MKTLLILSFAFAILASQVFAGCCVIESSNCNFFDLGTWSNQQGFCDFFKIAGINSTFYSTSCSDLSQLSNCCDGWSASCQKSELVQSILSSSHSGGGGSCVAKWNCSDWSDCINAQKTRVCNDIYKCTRSTKPSESMPCDASASAVPEPVASEPGQAEIISQTQPVNQITGSTVRDLVSSYPLAAILIIAGLVALSSVYFLAKHRTNRLHNPKKV